MLKRDGYRCAPPIRRARVWSQHVSKRHCTRSEAIHLFLFLATMDCFVASAPRNDASACVAIPSTVIGLAEGENRWWRGRMTMRRLARRVGQGRKNPRPRTNALLKTLQVVFFVRGMDIVVVQTEADQHRIETEGALEVGDDRDRCAGSHQDRFLAPLLGQRTPGGGE